MIGKKQTFKPEPLLKTVKTFWMPRTAWIFWICYWIVEFIIKINEQNMLWALKGIWEEATSWFDSKPDISYNYNTYLGVVWQRRPDSKQALVDTIIKPI